MTDPQGGPSAEKACLDPEQVAAYVDGGLPAHERGEVEVHLAHCEVCRELLVGIVTIPTHLELRGSLAPRHRFWRKRMITRLSALAAAAASIFAVVKFGPFLTQRLGKPAADQYIQPLVAAMSTDRTVTGRLTGGFSYGALRSGTRGATARENLALLAAAGKMQITAREDPTPESLHALGVARLLLGDDDLAIEPLEQAAGRRPIASFQADLAAAYLDRSEHYQRAEDLPKSLDLLERALGNQPALVEAAFTRACVLERLGLRDLAIQAWSRYLELDHDSGWAAEARQHIQTLRGSGARDRWPALRQALTEPNVSDQTASTLSTEFPDEVPEVVLGSMLAGWRDAEERGDPVRAAAWLASAERVARALDVNGGDQQLFASIRELRTPSSRRPSYEPRMLSQNVDDLVTGTKLLAQDRYADSEPYFSRASANLVDYPLLRSWAAFGLARDVYFRGRLDDARNLIDKVIATQPVGKRSTLRARAIWIRGIINFSAGLWTDAQRDYEEALRDFAGLHEWQNASIVHINLSILYRFLGDTAAVWRHREEALNHLPDYKATLYHGYLITAAVTASLEGLDRTALVFMNEAVSNATPNLPPYVRAESLLQRSRLWFRIGRDDNAEDDLEQARTAWKSIPDAAVKSRVAVSLETATAEVLQAQKPAVSELAAAKALGQAEQRGDFLRTAELSLYRARSLSAMGNVEGARSAVEHGILAFERARSSLSPLDPSRLSAFEPVWDLFDEAVNEELAQSQPRYEFAFANIERSRARTLFEARHLESIPLSRTMDTIDAATTMLLLHQQPTRLLVWVVRRHTNRLITLPSSASSSSEMVSEFCHALQAGDNSARRSAALYTTIMEPLLSMIPPGTTIVVIPDGPFVRVPWAAIRVPETGRLLLEDWPIVIAPSVSMALESPPQEARRIEALIVSAGDSESSLPILPGADAEAQAIAGLYAHSVYKKGKSASVSTVLKLAPDYTVIHISAHAVDSPAYPLLSHIALPSESGSDRGLQVQDLLASRRLRSNTLVVLAACSTAGQHYSRGEGSVGLAWGFLMAGAREVVATLWDVDDRLSTDLFVDFHRRLQTGERAAKALRGAQVAARARGVPDSVWAAVEVIGQH